MKVLIDTETRVTTFLEAGGATVVHPTEETVKVTPAGEVLNPATGKPATGVSGYVSETAGMIAALYSTDKVVDTSTTGDKETRQQFNLTNGQHIDIAMPTKRTVYELNRPNDRVEVVFHVKGASGKVRVQLAGATSGAVVGGAAIGGISGTTMEGTLDSYDKTVTASGDLDVNLRLDKGDSKVLLVLTPG